MKTTTFIAFACLVLAFELATLARWTTEQDTTSSSIDLKLDQDVINPPYVWNEQGCQQWALHKKQRLTGLAVSLLMQPAHEAYAYVMRFNVCNGSIASQRHHLLKPQGWDMLLIVAKESPSDPTWMTLDEIASCLQLSGSSPSTGTNFTLQTWQNLDGTTLTTRRYKDMSSNHSIFLAETQLNYPQYIQDNLTLLDYNIAPDFCQRDSSYIQAARWYTHEMLELGILQSYDYFVKIDADVWVLRTIPIDILWDLQLQNALLMHTAQYPGGVKCCTVGIVDAVHQFQQQQQASPTIDGWKGSMCSVDQVEVQHDVDLYYGNFLVGRVSFWQSPAVRAFGRFLTNYPEGFFLHRWGNQIFFHFAMGLFLGPNFTDHVADYTDMRCAPVNNCWQSINFDKYLNDYDRPRTCNNGGYFLHTKALEVEWNQTSIDKDVVRKAVPRISTYKEKCER